MTNADIREAHKLLDSLFDNSELSHAQIDLIRGLVPELPKQKTLEEIVHDVYEAWIASSGDEWIRDGVVGSVISLEDWLKELHEQLKGIKDTSAVFPALPAGMRLAAHENFGRVVVAPGVGIAKRHEILYLDPGMIAGTDIREVEPESLAFIDMEPANPTRPEFLETEADYAEAPNGTIVVKVDALPWVKEDNGWTCAGASKGDYGMSLAGSRRVLRWGWGE